MSMNTDVDLIPYLSFFIGIISCGLIEFVLHYEVSRVLSISDKKQFPILLAMPSIGHAFAHCYKGESDKEQLKKFIKICNFSNICISLVLMLLSFIGIHYYWFSIPFFLGINGYRFISRSFEIMLAFGFDVFDESGKGKSGLNKFERLKLAVISYFELYVYSATFYMTLISCYNYGDLWFLKSILMSLFVGTLTNVAYIQTTLCNSELLQLFPFIQIFATLSLVVLSLAVYVSRKDDAK